MAFVVCSNGQMDDSPPPGPEVIDDMLRRFRGIAQQLSRAEDLMREGREMRESADADFAKLRGYADLCGVDLAAELRARQEDQLGKLEPEAPTKTLTSLIRRVTVRDFILEQAERSYPEPVRAAELRRQFQQVTGQLVHEKTFGMTLYRLSQEDPSPVARVGHADWYFVPEEFRAQPESMRPPPNEDIDSADA